MKRALSLAVVGFACLTLAACQTAVSGSALSNSGGASSAPGVTASSAPGATAGSAPATSGPTSSDAPESASPASSAASTAAGSTGGAAGTGDPSTTAPTSSASDAGSGGGNTGGSSGNTGGSGNSGGGGGAGSPGNQPAIVSLKITCTYDADQVEYVAVAHYRVSNATGLAVSVDDPGAIGSFGSAKGTEGDIALPSNGCYADSGEQVYDFDTTGGSPRAHQEIKRTGTHQRGDKPAPPAVPAPSITESSLICTKQDDGSYQLTLQWAVANATGLALSVDNPGGVGSFGTYQGTSGHVDLPSNACYADGGSHEFDLQTVSGASTQATKVLHFNGGHSRPGSGDTTTTTTTGTTTAITTTTTTPPPPGG